MKMDTMTGAVHHHTSDLQDRMGYYDGTNLYEYVGANPPTYHDPSGLKLVLTGDDPNDVAAVQAIIDDIKQNGTEAAKARLKRIEDSAAEVKIKIVRNDKSIVIAHFPDKNDPVAKIDIGACEKFPEKGPGATKRGTVIHEIVEEGAHQIDGKAYPAAHKEGAASEKDVTGWDRLADLSPIEIPNVGVIARVLYQGPDGSRVISRTFVGDDNTIKVMPPEPVPTSQPTSKP